LSFSGGFLPKEDFFIPAWGFFNQGFVFELGYLFRFKGSDLVERILTEWHFCVVVVVVVYTLFSSG